jgi:hypothetical protein
VKRGDLLLAVCDPHSIFATDSCAMASLEEGGQLAFFDAAGNRLGTLGPDTTIVAIYISGAHIQQSVRELGPIQREESFIPVGN